MDQCFLQEEIRNGYKVSKEIKQLWAAELDLIEKLKEVCERNQLKYFIAGGTLLGAVRHKGFIPWDDDVDFLMPREDFEILKTIASREFKEPYFFQTEESDPDIFLGGYAKLRNSNTTMFENVHIYHDANFGIWIDIFVLDYVYEDSKKRKKQIKKIRFLQKLIYAKNYREYKSFLFFPKSRWIFYKFTAMFCSRRRLCIKMSQAMTCCKTSAYVSNLNYSYRQYWSQCFNTNDFADSILLDFEHLTLPAPVGYHNVLSMLYGNDYLDFPPKDQQKPHHNVILEPNIPYKRYMLKFDKYINDINGKTIIVFGAGKMLEHYLDHEGKNFPPEFAVDNDSKKWGTTVKGITVKGPESILTIQKDDLRVLICSIYYREIAKQLREMGIDNYYIYVQNKDWL